MKLNQWLVSGSKLVIFFSIWFSVALSANELDRNLVSASDLSRDAVLVKHSKRVLMIEFSSEYCGYCRQLEDEFLKPMLLNDEYHKKVLIRSVSLSDNDDLIDFDGNSISAYDLAAKYDVFVTPTLLFLDENGDQVSEKLVGIWSLDYYGGYIDQRIDSGLESRL
jgi:thioredoxin-related protein